MTAKALIKEADAKRLARAAKAEGVAVRFFPDGSVCFLPVIPDIPDTHKDREVDQDKEIIL